MKTWKTYKIHIQNMNKQQVQEIFEYQTDPNIIINYYYLRAGPFQNSHNTNTVKSINNEIEKCAKNIIKY